MFFLCGFSVFFFQPHHLKNKFKGVYCHAGFFLLSIESNPILIILNIGCYYPSLPLGSICQKFMWS